MHYGIINNGVVVNVAISDDSTFAASQGWVVLPEGAGIGWLYDGHDFSVADTEASPTDVPTSVSRRQALQALLLVGLLSNVQPIIDAIPDETERQMSQIYWDASQVFERSHSLVEAIGAALGLDSAGLDALFVQAASL